MTRRWRYRATGAHGSDAHERPSCIASRGDILLKRDPDNPAPAEEAFLTAIAIAKQQQCAQLRTSAASLSLAKLYQSTGRPAEAHAVLAPALEGFRADAGDARDRRGAGAARGAGGDEEVKAAEAQRQRRLHLQTAYGQAMMWAKGFAAEETRAAFWRATGLTARPTPLRSASRLATFNGPWPSCEANCGLRGSWS